MMKKKIRVAKSRNWGLVLICLLLIVAGSVLVLVAVTNIPLFGWWSLFFGASGLTTIVASVLSIVTNDSSWILLDLILPG